MEGLTKKKKTLDNEMTETVTAQISLDKTAEAFRTAHRDRQEVIKQWEHTIEQMRKRDHDMDKCANVSLCCTHSIMLVCGTKLVGVVEGVSRLAMCLI